MRNIPALMTGIVLVLLTSASFAGEMPRAKAVAVPIDRITVDGDLSDWPDGLETHYILNVGDPYGPTDLDGKDLMTSDDLSPSFKIAYNPTENLIYVAITMRDDYMASGYGFTSTDGVEVYIEGTKRNKVLGPRERRIAAGSLAAVQYVMATPGGSYDAKRPGAPEPKNPRMTGGDISTTRTKCGHSRSGNITIYEMAVDPYDKFPDTRTKLEPGRILGMDIVVNDVDDNGDRPAWVCWGPYKPYKFFDTSSLGEVILAGKDNDLVKVTGIVTDRREKAPFADFVFAVYRGDELLGMSSADENGSYELLLPPGIYSLKPEALQGVDVDSVKKIKVKSGKDVVANFSPKEIKLPKVLTKSAALYKSFSSYSDSMLIEIKQIKDNDTKTDKLPFDLAFKKPKMFRMDCAAETTEMISSLYINDKECVMYYPSQKRYMKNQLPENLEISNIQMPAWQLAGNAIDLHFILSDNPLKVLLKNVSSLREIGKEKLDGENTVVIEIDKNADSFTSSSPQMISIMPSGLGGGDTTVTMWIGAKDYLIKRLSFTIDLDAMSASMPPALKERFSGKAEITISHKNIVKNASIPDDTFAFKAPDDASEIRFASNVAPSVKPQEKKLGGKAAPDFALEDLDGNQMKLSDCKGHVVVIEFWSSWIDKCVEPMKTLQKIHESFQGKEVDIIGINSLDGEDADVLKEFLDEHGISYRNLIDAKEEVVEKFGFTKVPVCFIIDKRGMVMQSFTELPEEEMMKKMISALLSM